MSFIDMVITRREFEARYLNVGRCMLGTLADILCVDVDQAERWADEIDREIEQQIAAARSPLTAGSGKEGVGIGLPSALSTLSRSVAFGSHDGPGAAAPCTGTAAPPKIPQHKPVDRR